MRHNLLPIQALLWCSCDQSHNKEVSFVLLNLDIYFIHVSRLENVDSDSFIED